MSRPAAGHQNASTRTSGPTRRSRRAAGGHTAAAKAISVELTVVGAPGLEASERSLSPDGGPESEGRSEPPASEEPVSAQAGEAALQKAKNPTAEVGAPPVEADPVEAGPVEADPVEASTVEASPAEPPAAEAGAPQIATVESEPETDSLVDEPPGPVNYDEEGIGEVEIDGAIYRFDSGKQGTALCLSLRREGAWRWSYLGELRWDGRDLRSKALDRSLLTQLSASLRTLAAQAN